MGRYNLLTFLKKSGLPLDLLNFSISSKLTRRFSVYPRLHPPWNHHHNTLTLDIILNKRSSTRFHSGLTMLTKENKPQHLFATNDYAVIVLNMPIELDNEFFFKIWNNAIIRHVVDGGTNRFFSILDRQPTAIKDTVRYPELASGDFDSITDDSMNRLKDKEKSKCKIIETEDQNETDFTKALRVLKNELRSSGATAKLKSIIAICEFSGRLDQTMGNLQTLHKNVFLEDLSVDSPTVYLMGAKTLSWLLPANYNSVISFEKEVPNFTCGIIPLQGPTVYTTKGLQWDLTPDMVCQFGSLVSTSNNVTGKVLKICPENNHSIFSLEMKVNDYIL